MKKTLKIILIIFIIALAIIGFNYKKIIYYININKVENIQQNNAYIKIYNGMIIEDPSVEQFRNYTLIDIENNRCYRVKTEDYTEDYYVSVNSIENDEIEEIVKIINEEYENQKRIWAEADEEIKERRANGEIGLIYRPIKFWERYKVVYKKDEKGNIEISTDNELLDKYYN